MTTLLEAAHARVTASPFNPDDPVTAMSAGLLEGFELRLPFARPSSFWQSSLAYHAGFRAGCSGVPSVLTRLGSVPEWSDPSGLPIEVHYIDGSSFVGSATNEIQEALLRDPTVVYYTIN